MPLPKIEDARNLSDQELNDQILATKRQLFELRMQKATRQLEKSHQFKHARHQLAQLMTVEHERKRATAQQTSESPTPSKEA
ncbi:MAG: 50S ribosomal protein L29 [Leptolyngbyaceae cyanobacterium bins.59]|nr:50S ribosomal protein L29 [Leptolyngbyaceae cyanobacterium bins.59]